MNPMTVEEGLRRLEDRAAMLRFFADAAAASRDQVVPEPSAFSGMADACAAIVTLVRQTRRSLTAEALSADLKPVPRSEL